MSDPAKVRRHAERVRELVASVVRTQIKDPRLGMITITDTRITADLRDATVFYTVLGDAAAQASTAAALESAKGLLRSTVGKALGLRHSPTLTFVLDDVQDQVKHIDELLAVARNADGEVQPGRPGPGTPGTRSRTGSMKRTTRTSRQADDEDGTAPDRRGTTVTSARPLAGPCSPRSRYRRRTPGPAAEWRRRSRRPPPRRVQLVCHVNPDGDALGSMLGFALGLRRLGIGSCARGSRAAGGPRAVPRHARSRSAGTRVRGVSGARLVICFDAASLPARSWSTGGPGRHRRSSWTTTPPNRVREDQSCRPVRRGDLGGRRGTARPAGVPLDAQIASASTWRWRPTPARSGSTRPPRRCTRWRPACWPPASDRGDLPSDLRHPALRGGRLSATCWRGRSSTGRGRRPGLFADLRHPRRPARYGQRPYVLETLIDSVRSTAEADVSCVIKPVAEAEWAVSLRSKGGVDVAGSRSRWRRRAPAGGRFHRSRRRHRRGRRDPRAAAAGAHRHRRSGIIPGEYRASRAA